MKILMLPTQGSGVGAYRHWTPAKSLIRAGHNVWYTESESVFSKLGQELDTFLMEKAACYDLIHIGFTTSSTLLEKLVAVRNYAQVALGKALPLLTDCDDDILHVPAYNTGFKAYTGSAESRKVALLNLRVSEVVTVTTPPLTETYAPYNNYIHVLPNCVDPNNWSHLTKDPNRATSGDVRIMFAGNLGRKADLDLIQPALEAVMRQRPNVRLFFMGMMPDWVEQWVGSVVDPEANRAFFMNGAELDVYRNVLAWVAPDIMVAPVVSNKFNAGKSSIKVMEAALVGAASVCSDWQTYKEVPAEATLKCDTTYEWTESLLALVDDPSLRAKKVATCLQWVLDCKSIDTNIYLWENAYEEALARPVITDEGTGIKENQIVLPTARETQAIANSIVSNDSSTT